MAMQDLFFSRPKIQVAIFSSSEGGVKGLPEEPETKKITKDCIGEKGRIVILPRISLLIPGSSFYKNVDLRYSSCDLY